MRTADYPLRREMDALLRRPALTVDRYTGNGHRKPRSQCRMPRDISGLLSNLQHASGDYVLNPISPDACASKKSLDDLSV
jgi:hypothetical protein